MRRKVRRVAEHMRMAADHFLRDRLDDAAEVKGALFLGDARVKGDLQQKIAQLLAQIDKIVARDRVGDLIGLLDRIGRDRCEGLRKIPATAGFRRAQGRHDVDQTLNVGGRLHAGSGAGGRIGK